MGYISCLRESFSTRGAIVVGFVVAVIGGAMSAAAGNCGEDFAVGSMVCAAGAIVSLTANSYICGIVSGRVKNVFTGFSAALSALAVCCSVGALFVNSKCGNVKDTIDSCNKCDIYSKALLMMAIAGYSLIKGIFINLVGCFLEQRRLYYSMNHIKV